MTKKTLAELKNSCISFFDSLGTVEMTDLFNTSLRTPVPFVLNGSGQKETFYPTFTNDDEVKDRESFVLAYENTDEETFGIRFENIPQEISPRELFSNDSDKTFILFSGSFSLKRKELPRIVYVLKVHDTTTYGFSVDLLVFNVGSVVLNPEFRCLSNPDTCVATCVAHIGMVGLDNILNNEEYAKIFTSESLSSYKSSKSMYYRTPQLKTPINITKSLIHAGIYSWSKRDLLNSSHTFEDGVHRILINM